MANLKPRSLTPEQWQAVQAKRVSDIRQMQAQTKDYKKDWLDAEWWISLAKEQGIRLPPWYVPATPANLRKWTRKLVGTGQFQERFGCSPERLITLNPRTPLRAFVGQMLEP